MCFHFITSTYIFSLLTANSWKADFGPCHRPWNKCPSWRCPLSNHGKRAPTSCSFVEWSPGTASAAQVPARDNPMEEKLAPVHMLFSGAIYILCFCLSEPKQHKQCQIQFSDYFQTDWIWHMTWFYLINAHVVQNKTNLKWKALSAFIKRLRWIYNYFVFVSQPNS